MSALVRISELFDVKENEETTEKIEINNIKLNQLSYSYNGLDNVIKGIDLQLIRVKKL